MIKNCTDIEQSKKLVELGIDINTADMYYPNRVGMDNYALSVEWKNGLPLLSQEIPAWSLTALLNILLHPRCFQGDKPTYWFCGCLDKDYIYHEVESSNPIDACVDMIVKLHEKNLL